LKTIGFLLISGLARSPFPISPLYSMHFQLRFFPQVPGRSCNSHGIQGGIVQDGVWQTSQYEYKSLFLLSLF